MTLIAPAARTQDEWLVVRAEGFAEGTGFAAREAAIDDARHEAVLSVLRSLGIGEDLAPVTAILRNAARYVPAYDVLRSDPGEATTRVELDAKVLEDPLRRDVAAIMLPRLPEPPRILLVCGAATDPQGAAPPPLKAVEDTLAEGLAKLGLDVTRYESVAPLYPEGHREAVVAGDVEAGRRFATENTAQVVLLVRAAVRARRPDVASSNLFRNEAMLHARVFRGADGKMTDDLTATAAVHGADPAEGAELALRDACAKLLGDTVVSATLTVLAANAPNRVLLVIENPAPRGRFDKVVTLLRAMIGEEAVSELFYSDPLARLHLDYDGPMSLIVDHLTPVVFDGKRLEVRRAVARELVLRFP